MLRDRFAYRISLLGPCYRTNIRWVVVGSLRKPDAAPPKKITDTTDRLSVFYIATPDRSGNFGDRSVRRRRLPALSRRRYVSRLPDGHIESRQSSSAYSDFRLCRSLRRADPTPVGELVLRVVRDFRPTLAAELKIKYTSAAHIDPLMGLLGAPRGLSGDMAGSLSLTPYM